MSQTLEEWAGSSRMVALVFTDIVDSTSLANKLGDEQWIEILLNHFQQARWLMSGFDCHEIKIIGDSFMVAFRTAVDALDFVLAFHEDTGDYRIRIRAGIHVGPVRFIDNDMFGMMVNYTKRVESTDNPHWIVVSDEAKHHIDYEKASRHSNIRFRPRSVEFKGFTELQNVWRVYYPQIREIIREKVKAAQQVISGAPRTLPPTLPRPNF